MSEQVHDAAGACEPGYHRGSANLGWTTCRCGKVYWDEVSAPIRVEVSRPTYSPGLMATETSGIHPPYSETYQRRMTGAIVNPEDITPLRRLGAAIGDVGRIIESLPPHERRDSVRAVVETMTEGERLSFLIGVFVWAHEQRIEPAREPTQAELDERERIDRQVRAAWDQEHHGIVPDLSQPWEQ